MEAPVLSPEGLQRRLGRIPAHDFTTTLTPEQLAHTFSRQQFSDRWRGSIQNTWVDIKTTVGPIKGGTEIMFPNNVMNPYLPEYPGAPGLFFNANVDLEDEEEDKDWIGKTDFELIARVASKKWRYKGTYRLRKSEPLSVEEWQQQSAAV